MSHFTIAKYRSSLCLDLSWVSNHEELVKGHHRSAKASGMQLYNRLLQEPELSGLSDAGRDGWYAPRTPHELLGLLDYTIPAAGFPPAIVPRLKKSSARVVFCTGCLPLALSV